jgi:KDO2-lipid IV(A) lauroyltransferase
VLPRHGAIKHIPTIVAAGGYVALVVDQRARGKTVLAPFFGRLAHCERAFAVLARRLRVPLVVGMGIKMPEPDRYALRVPRVFWPEELAALDPAGILGAINAEFERMILAQPDQYLWLHDRYRNAPPAEASDPR